MSKKVHIREESTLDGWLDPEEDDKAQKRVESQRKRESLKTVSEIRNFVKGPS